MRSYTTLHHSLLFSLVEFSRGCELQTGKMRHYIIRYCFHWLNSAGAVNYRLENEELYYIKMRSYTTLHHSLLFSLVEFSRGCELQTGK